MERPEKIGTFMRMLMKEAMRNSLIDLCDSWDISEEEMDKCIAYLRQTLKVNI